ncbi:MAG: type II toxin-antitoxin system VapC family toxin [Candidatus Methanofastidiosia archaeon]|jgi:predicted nucleic acid-binding protein
MRKPTIYLDTSVISALFDERTPERLALTKEFWKKIPDYQVYISETTEKEMEAASETLKKKMIQVTKDFKILPVKEEVENLANEYIKKGIFPERYKDDALHVSVATVNRIMYLLSWNFKHMVKVRTRRTVNLVNELQGYPSIELLAPPEL